MEVPGYAEARELGRGGFAVVYAARSEATGETVALKVFTSSDVDGRRVRRELVALERLSGIPGVVPVLGVTAASDGNPVMVMPFYPTTMAARVADGGVPVEQAVDWLTEIATALDQAALLGVSHRDVKPGNVLLDNGGRAHLADFGISALGEMDTGTTTAMAFSPPYAAPERLEGRTVVDLARSDIYSLAATTWAAIVGGAPFGTATTGGVSGLVHRVMANELDQPTHMPSALYDVLRAGMALNPEDRYSSASALAGAARQALEVPEDLTVARPLTASVPLVAVPQLPGHLDTNTGTGGSVEAAAGHDLSGSDGFGSHESRESRDPDDGDDSDDIVAVSSNGRKIAAIAACALLVIGAAVALALIMRSDPDVVVASRASDGRTETTDGRTKGTPPPTVEGTTTVPVTEIGPGGATVTNTTLATADASGFPTSVGTPKPGPMPSTTPTPAPAAGAGSAPAPAAAPAPTATLPPVVPGSCTITNGIASLSPGIPPVEMSPQAATLRAQVSCQLSRGGPLSGSLLLFTQFPSLGFWGGTSTGTGSISWVDGQATQMNGTVDVILGPPNDGIDNYDVKFALGFTGGFGAPGSTTMTLPALAVFDPLVGRVVSISDMNGSFAWKR